MPAGRNDDPLLYFNGIDGATGRYDVPPMTAEQLARFILKEEAPGNLEELREKESSGGGQPLEAFHPFDLALDGWGAIFAEGTDPAIEEALSPLLELRREQAGDLFRCFSGRELAVSVGESKTKWLARHGIGPGAPIVELVPRFLLLVGSPEAISFRFQSQLDVQYAVGRIHFDSPEEYANYAASVVRAEKDHTRRPNRATFFGAINGDDPATVRTTGNLVQPLGKKMGSLSQWEIAEFYGADASKAALSDVLGGPNTPKLLFSGSHGHKLPLGNARQRAHQGALICSDWLGPNQWGGGPIPQDFYMAGDDLSEEADLSGLIAFFYACYGGGTPLRDEFVRQGFNDMPAQIADAPFLADLPRRMLNRPRGGALAVVSHVERVWNCSYEWPGVGFQRRVFEKCLEQLMIDGLPVGLALDGFDSRYAELSTVLSDLIEEIEGGTEVDFAELAFNWTANNDARGYIIIGDPAVKLQT